MDDLQKRFQKRRAEILENPEPVEDAQFVTPSNVSKSRAEAKRLLAKMLSEQGSIGIQDKSVS